MNLGQGKHAGGSNSEHRISKTERIPNTERRWALKECLLTPTLSSLGGGEGEETHAPVHGSNARIQVRGILTPALSPGERENCRPLDYETELEVACIRMRGGQRTARPTQAIGNRSSLTIVPRIGVW